MKGNKNKNSEKDQRLNAGTDQRNTSSRETPAPSGGMHRQEGTENTKEKKPISHRTGDATNFGDRSYQED